MPAPNLKSFAKEVGISMSKAEEYWKKAKDIAEEEFGKNEKDFGDREWSYVMGVVKNMMGIKESKLKEMSTQEILSYYVHTILQSKLKSSGNYGIHISFKDGSSLIIHLSPDKRKIVDINDTLGYTGAAAIFKKQVTDRDIPYMLKMAGKPLGEEKMKEKEIFFESELSAKDFIEVKCKKTEEEDSDKTDDEIEETMTSGSFSGQVPSNPIKPKDKED